MNDLLDVRQALGEPELPSPATQAAARAALLEHAAAARASLSRPWPAGARRRRRAGWLAGGIGLTAAAAVTAAALVTTSPPRPDGRGNHRNTSAEPSSRLSARQILLAAAITAAAQPARTGAYWYLKETGPGPAAATTTQSWYTHNGSTYTLLPPRHVVFLASPDAGFDVGASALTYRQIQRLPTTAAALTAWITRSFAHPVGPSGPAGVPRARQGPPPRSELGGQVAMSLSDLLYQVPAPPAIRAAAFRALAALPDVTRLGQAHGDVTLRISVAAPPANKFPSGKVPPRANEIRLVISTSTLALHAVTNYEGTTTILAARWTSTRPPAVRP